MFGSVNASLYLWMLLLRIVSILDSKRMKSILLYDSNFKLNYMILNCLSLYLFSGESRSNSRGARWRPVTAPAQSQPNPDTTSSSLQWEQPESRRCELLEHSFMSASSFKMVLCTCFCRNGSENIWGGRGYSHQIATICPHGSLMPYCAFMLITLPSDSLCWYLWCISLSCRRVRTWTLTLTRSRHRKRSPGTSPCDDTLWAWVTLATRWVTDQTREYTRCTVFLFGPIPFCEILAINLRTQ